MTPANKLTEGEVDTVHQSTITILSPGWKWMECPHTMQLHECNRLVNVDYVFIGGFLAGVVLTVIVAWAVEWVKGTRAKGPPTT
jgi:hypothetical protein